MTTTTAKIMTTPSGLLWSSTAISLGTPAEDTSWACPYDRTPQNSNRMVHTRATCILAMDLRSAMGENSTAQNQRKEKKKIPGRLAEY